MAAEGNKRAQPITAVRPGHADLAGCAQVRVQRRPQRARALLRARDDGTGRRRRGRPGVPARARDRGLVVHGRGGRRGRGPGPLHAVPRRGRRVAAALPGPGRRGGDDRPHRRGALERRHGGRRVRGGRPRRPDRPRQLRPVGPAPGRGAGAGRHEHPHRQGRGAGPRVRADASLRLAGPRRDRRPTRRRDLGPPHATTRAASPAAITNGEPIVVRGAVKPISTLARPLPTADLVTGEAGREGALRAQRHLGRPGGRRHRRGDGDADAGRGSCWRRRAATRWPRCVDNLRRYQERIARTPSAPVAGDGSGGHAEPGVARGRATAGRPPVSMPIGPRMPTPAPWRTAEARRVDVVLVGPARAPARPPSGGGSRTATGRSSSTSTSGSRRRAGRPIPEIFAEDGEAAFRRLERDAVAALGAARRRPRDPARDLARRRRRRGPAQPVGALPRAGPGLARRPPRGPGAAAAPLPHRAAAGPGRRPARAHPAAGGRAGALLRCRHARSTASPRSARSWMR